MFNRKPMVKKKQGMMEAVDDPDLSFSKIKKDFQLFASSHMTWKDKKALENQKVSGLGGKPQRKQRLPLSVARVQMKKQKEREEKTFEQNVIFGQFGGTSRKKPAADKKRKPEERVLKSTFGNFRGGVLDVKDLLRSGGSSRTNDRDNNYGKDKNKSKGMEVEEETSRKQRKEAVRGKASNIC
ncbi:hypothetical protein BRARA_E01096 [Brassica rapa]|uniref:Uncharacterized protein n=2 Tax=Brassica campestris TaxID=3711 RepID=A0A397ZCI3_BRACM|nr:hypothetical protein IGI04_018350 [Brassica rapa subsp. trilocularis]RID61994.1 hypothetical protein BRARA_E01096 [Brassica rapa]